jgi:peroxiredoxin
VTPAFTGGSAPDFTARDIDGKTVTLSNHLGKDVVLLDFCTTWCEPCIQEFPHLRALYESNKDKGFIILAISVDGPETAGSVPALARRNRLNFPMLVDEDSTIAERYNPRKTAPVTVLIDRTGRVTAIREGYTAGDEHALALDVAKALDSTPSR